MNKIPQISEAIQTVLTTTADASAQKTGFTKAPIQVDRLCLRANPRLGLAI